MRWILGHLSNAPQIGAPAVPQDEEEEVGILRKPRILTEPYIRSLKPAATGKRYAVADALVPGLKVRVTDKGSKSFIVWRRYGGASNPAARAIGSVGAMTLAEAREKARDWIDAIKRGDDPRRSAAKVKNMNTFGVIMEDYLKRHVAGKRKAKDVNREIRKELLSRWRNKPLASITRKDVIQLVDEIKDRGAVYQAHNIFGHAKTFFNWAIERGIYGIETSPCDRMKPSRLIGTKHPRKRVLSDVEIAAFWRASGELHYPIGPLFRMLLLTAQRKSEVAEASWREFDLQNRLWVIPSERFKSNATHTIPLSPDALALLETVPRWKGGDFLFSNTGGVKPVNSFSKAKLRLDRSMLLSLWAVARKRGVDPQNVVLEPFVIHDLRRTVRTRLSSLHVPDKVAEMVIGHGPRGIQRIYDLHTYLPEMREALDRWASLLRSIVEIEAALAVE
jgi:integrase